MHVNWYNQSYLLSLQFVRLSNQSLFILQLLDTGLDFQKFFLKEWLLQKIFRARYFVPLKRMFGARMVHAANVPQIFSALYWFLHDEN